MVNYDVIGINEVKTEEPVHFPGYVTFRSMVTQSSNRGGTVVLVRNCIVPFVHKVDTSVNDQVCYLCSSIYHQAIPNIIAMSLLLRFKKKSSQNICLMVTS